MAKREINRSLGLALAVAMICAPQQSLAQSGCTTAIISLAPCLGFITGNSSTPSPGCCTQLASVVQNNALCLCQLLNGGGSSFGININQTQALALPGACKVQTPPVSQCNAGTPASSPSASPATPTPTTPSTPSTPGSSTPTPATPSVPSTPSGSKNTPGDSSGTTTTTMMFPVLFISAIILSFTGY